MKFEICRCPASRLHRIGVPGSRGGTSAAISSLWKSVQQVWRPEEAPPAGGCASAMQAIAAGA